MFSLVFVSREETEERMKKDLRFFWGKLKRNKGLRSCYLNINDIYDLGILFLKIG